MATSDETAVEARLREMADRLGNYFDVCSGADNAHAADCGLKAIRLLREPLSMRVEDSARWQADVRALLARCQEGRWP